MGYFPVLLESESCRFDPFIPLLRAVLLPYLIQPWGGSLGPLSRFK